MIILNNLVTFKFIEILRVEHEKYNVPIGMYVVLQLGFFK